MEIALLNQRITFQRNATLTDSIGNHTKRLWRGQRLKMRIVPLPCVGADRRRMSARQAIVSFLGTRFTTSLLLTT